MNEIALYLLSLLDVALIWLVFHILSTFQQERELMQKERKDLYDRLMAGTLAPYKEQVVEPDVENELEMEDELSSLDDAKEELLNG